MDNKELLQERIQLFKDAAHHKKTKRILNFATFWTWKIYDAGYTIEEANKDYQIREKVVRSFQEKYQFDLHLEEVLGIRNPLRLADALGRTDYIINNETFALVFPSDICYMEPDEYDEAMDNYTKFLWTKVMPRKFPKLKEPQGKEMITNGVKEFLQFGQFTQHINQVLAEDYGVPPLAVQKPFPFFEAIFNSLRGIKGTSLDIRRQPEKVEEACEKIGFNCFGPDFETYMKTIPKGTDMNFAADIQLVFLGHSILSPKQFEKFYWPALKKVFDFAEEKDKIVYIYAEHNNERFYDFFKEAPKGHIIIHPEMDDIFKAKKEIGDKVCLAGGMPAHLLYYGTKEENIAYAKRLIDELGSDGGYIFSQNKMISYPNDCKAENLKAVNDFVREYTL